MDRENHRDVEARAAQWLARRDAGGWSAQDDAQLERWLESSTAHRVAFLRLEMAWDSARRLKALGAGVAAGSVPPRGSWAGTLFFARAAGHSNETDTASQASDSPAPEEAAEPAFSRLRANPSLGWPRRSIGLAAALCLLLVAGIASYLKLGFDAEHYATPVGGLSSVPLADGSTITLNTSSAVSVQMRSSERHIVLERGEGFFTVAKDPHRPFVVEAGDRRVIAVGTQFAVRREEGGLRVIVSEGKVRLEARNLPPEQRSTSLVAGEVARISDDALLIQKDASGETQRLLSWRQGYLTFRDTPLAEALAELNRYNTRKIALGDPRVGAIRISGTFRPTNYAAFVRLLQQGFAVRALESSDDTILLVAD